MEQWDWTRDSTRLPMNGRYLGGIFIVWDRMFGTYEAEEEPVVFGITEPTGSNNPIVVNFYEIYAIARDCWRARRSGDCWGYIFGPPGWRPRASPIGEP